MLIVFALEFILEPPVTMTNKIHIFFITLKKTCKAFIRQRKTSTQKKVTAEYAAFFLAERRVFPRKHRTVRNRARRANFSKE